MSRNQQRSLDYIREKRRLATLFIAYKENLDHFGFHFAYKSAKVVSVLIKMKFDVLRIGRLESSRYGVYLMNARDRDEMRAVRNLSVYPQLWRLSEHSHILRQATS
jgi:hypothetical protein